MLPEFSPVFPVPVIASLCGALALLVLWRAARGRALRPAWFQPVAALLRLGSIALLGLLLMNPSRSVPVSLPDSRSVILLDSSASMSLSAAEGRTRWEEASAWAEKVVSLAAGKQLAPPSILTWDATLHPDALSPSVLGSMKPAGPASKPAAALESILTTSAQAPDQVFLVSDGQAQDRAALPGVLAGSRALGAAIFTTLTGVDAAPRNAWLAAVQTPRIVRPGARVTLHADVSGTGMRPGEVLQLAVKDENGVTVATGDVPLPAPEPGKHEATASRIVSFDAGLRTSRYTLSLVSSGAPEVVTDDNQFSFSVEIASSKLRVLLVEGTHVKRTVGNAGHWFNDIELITRYGEATGGIEYDVLTPVSEYLNSPNLVGVNFVNGEMRVDPSRTFPKTREEMNRYDVMFISDVPVGNFSEQQMKWVVEWVTERGGGFLMGGGYTTFDVGHYDQTAWEKIIPVDMLAYGDGYNQEDFEIAIPASVRTHPLWRIAADPTENNRILDTHPIFTGMNRVRRAKPGALVLMTRPDMNNEPVFAAQSYGRGRSIAYLADPNGGWAKYFISWGPPGGPPQGPHTELGHGDRFKFNEQAAASAQGPVPPHPSPWYGQFWVNVVKWLGENSIRWRRDKLSGRVVAAQVQPGKPLPVAAEVLAVSGAEAMLGLNVGARLDVPGSPRTRLTYDRDRREFAGELPVPASLTGETLNVVFDTRAGEDALTDVVTAGIRRANPEFTEAKPDAAFLRELAAAGGGRLLAAPEEAVQILADAAAVRAREAASTFREPLWLNERLWAALAGLLCLEWYLRRRGAASAAAAVMLAFSLLLPRDATAAGPEPEPAKDAAEAAALIADLGAPLVRVRDAAQARLMVSPDAFDAVKQAVNEAPSEEARLRAAKIAVKLREGAWVPVKYMRAAPYPESLRISPDGKFAYVRTVQSVEKWDLAAGELVLKFGDALPPHQNWESRGPESFFDISPDGKTAVSTGKEPGLINLHSTETGELIKVLVQPVAREIQQTSYTYSVISEEEAAAATDPENIVRRALGGTTVPMRRSAVTMTRQEFSKGDTLWAADFSEDGKSLLTTQRNGAVTVRSLETGEPVLSNVGRETPVKALWLPGGQRILCATDAATDWLQIHTLADAALSEIPLIDRIYAMSLIPGTDMIAGVGREQKVILWKIGDSGLTELKRTPLTQVGEALAATSAGAGVIGGTIGPDCYLFEVNAETGEELWRSLPMATSFTSIAMITPDSFIAALQEGTLSLWQRRTTKPRAQ